MFSGKTYRLPCAPSPGLLPLIAVCALALSGCPGSNYSGPSLASPQAPEQTTPVVTPPPADQGATPPVVVPPPAVPGTVAAPPAQVPTASDGTLSTTMGATKTGTLVGTGTDALTYAIVVPTLSGTAKLIDPSSGTFSYAPNADFSGTDRFQFTVSDSVGTSAPATVTITVTPSSLGALTVPANIGVNVEGVAYYNVAEQYVDIMRMAGKWLSTSSDTVNGANRNLQEIGKLDADGWPTEDAGIMMVSGGVANGGAADPGPGSNLLGRYQLSFNGIAKLYNNGGTVEGQHYDAATNTTTATLVPKPTGADGTTAQVRVFFNQSQRTAGSPVNTGVTNVRVIRPQFAPNGVKWWDSPSQQFTNPFLASLAPFSTLRFMDWMDTNGNQQADWNQRTPPDWRGEHTIKTDGVWEWNATDGKREPTSNVWSTTGQSWESAIDLANVTGKDMWINIPSRATDAYVKSLATLLKQRLKAGIDVYVEYSNELWNFNFEHQYYNDAMTKALLGDNAKAAADYQRSCPAASAQNACRAAERTLQISNDFASVWGAGAINTTIRPVFCWQTGATAMQTAMGYIKETYGAPNQYFYGVCSAPYWKPAKVTAGESVDDLLAASATALPGRNASLLVYTVTAAYYGLHNLTYEGGPGMDDRSQIDLPNMIAANGDPRMGQQVTQALTGAFQNGVDMYVYFNSSGTWSKYGMWGATNDIFDLAQSKWKALDAISGKPITRTLAVVDPASGPRPGTALPGSINAGKPNFGVIGDTLQAGTRTVGGSCTAAANGWPDTCRLHGDKPEGNTEYGYMVVAPEAGSYTVVLQVGGKNSNPAATAQLYVNRATQGGAISLAASAAGHTGQSAPINITLPAGISLIELEATSSYFDISSISISANH